MPLNIDIDVQDCETLTLEIIDAPVSSGVSIDDAAGLGDTDVTWSANKTVTAIQDGDAVLRQDLANPDNGASMISYGIDTVKTALDRMPRGQGAPVEHLDIPTWDGDPNVTHPGVLYIPEGFGGYSYWMVHTPFPDDFRELPEIVVSNDGHNWFRPEGVPVPLFTNAQFTDALGPTYLYNSDPHILMLHDGRLAVYMRPVGGSFGGPFNEWLIRSVTSDGVNWSPIEVCAATAIGDDITYRSPAIVAEPDGTYSMWSTATWPAPPAHGPDNNIVKRVSTDGVNWSEAALCTTAGNLRAWHIDVQRTPDGTYHMLINASSGSQLLYYWTSTDGISWQPGCGQANTQAIPLISGVDKTGRYRCAFQAVAGEAGRFHVWLTTVDNRTTPPTYRIGAFLPSYPLAGYKNLNITDAAIRHHGVRAFGLSKADSNRSLFFGLDAGVDNTGTQQTAIGELAGYQNSGLQCFQAGSRAGYQNTGAQQVAVGRRAGEGNKRLQQVAVGFEAGMTNDGDYCTQIGVGAGKSNTGSNQVAVGRNAGEGNTAHNTTSVGAMASAIHLNAVALGYQAQSQRADSVCVGARDIESTKNGGRILLKSPNGTLYALSVSDSGELSASPA